MSYILSRVVIRNVILNSRPLAVCGGFFTTKTAEYHTTRQLESPQPDLTEFAYQAADYGKYCEPTKWESLYSSFVDSGLVRAVESYLSTVHDYTGLPWWVTIVICTVGMRATITAPLFVWQMRKQMKYRMLVPVLEKITQVLKTEGLRAAKENRWDEKTRDMHVFNSYIKRRRELYRQHKVPGTLRRHLLPLIQLPLWFAMSAALRHMTLSLPFITNVTASQAQTFVVFSKEGVLWFGNLCAADPYFVLPVLMALANLATIEIHRGDGKTPLVGISKVLVNFLRVVSVLMIPVACYMPSGVVFYWFVSSTFGVSQALAMQSIQFRKLLRLPIPSNQSATPYRDILSRFKIGDKSS